MSYSYRDDRDQNLCGETSNPLWKRGGVLVLFMIGFGLAQSVLFFVAIVQFVWMIANGERNAFLAQLGYALSLWMADAARFLSGDSEEKPFPWKPWPEV